MKERPERIAEMKFFTMNIRLIYIFFRRDARQTRICIRIPFMQHVHFVLVVANLAQVPDVVVIPVTVEVVNLHRGEPPLVPGPNHVVHLDFITSSIVA